MFENTCRLSRAFIDLPTAREFNVEFASFKKFYFFAKNYYPYTLLIIDLLISQVGLKLIHYSLSESERLIALGVLHNLDKEGTDALNLVYDNLSTESRTKFNFGG